MGRLCDAHVERSGVDVRAALQNLVDHLDPLHPRRHMKGSKPSLRQGRTARAPPRDRWSQWGGEVCGGIMAGLHARCGTVARTSS